MTKTGIFIYPKGKRKPFYFSLFEKRYGSLRTICCDQHEVEDILNELEQAYNLTNCDVYIEGFPVAISYPFYKPRRGLVHFYYGIKKTFIMISDQKSA